MIVLYNSYFICVLILVVMFVKCVIIASFFCDYDCNTPDFCRVYFDLFHIHNSTFFILHSTFLSNICSNIEFSTR